jgi:predicted double-glycine peptidase
VVFTKQDQWFSQQDWWFFSTDGWFIKRMSDFVSRRRWFAPEVVQTSNMDCGPASLKCLLEGYGVRASYGRLREACQTDVDGTSIDTLEEVAVQLGLQAEQVMLPLDYLLTPEAKALPALVVVRLPGGATHFVVLWRRHGRFVQIMDPATGRRWLTVRRFLSEVYVHSMDIPAATWREWAGSESNLAVLRRRMKRLGVASALLDRALSDPSWRGLGALDARLRLIHSLGFQTARDESIPAELLECPACW